MPVPTEVAGLFAALRRVERGRLCSVWCRRDGTFLALAQRAGLFRVGGLLVTRPGPQAGIGRAWDDPTLPLTLVAAAEPEVEAAASAPKP